MPPIERIFLTYKPIHDLSGGKRGLLDFSDDEPDFLDEDGKPLKGEELEKAKEKAEKDKEKSEGDSDWRQAMHLRC